MKKVKLYSIIGSMALLMASCTSFNSNEQDDSFGWENYPKSEQRNVDYSSTYAEKNVSNSTELLDDRPSYISDYSTYSTAAQPEVRYIPVVVPWWSPYSYSYYYYEPIYYTPGFYISMSFGNYYYPHYGYYRPTRYWHSDWYYWHHQRFNHPYHYGYYWDDNYGYHNGGNHNNNNGTKPVKSSGFGGRIFGANRGWDESNTIKPKTPTSTTPRSETRGGKSDGTNNTPAPTPTNGNGGRKIFDEPIRNTNSDTKNNDKIVNPNSATPVNNTPTSNTGRKSIFDSPVQNTNSGTKNTEPIKNDGGSRRDIFSNPAPVKEREVKNSNPGTNTNREPSIRQRETPREAPVARPVEKPRETPVARPAETPRREESKPASSGSSSSPSSSSPKSTTERSNTRGGR